MPTCSMIGMRIWTTFIVRSLNVSHASSSSDTENGRWKMGRSEEEQFIPAYSRGSSAAGGTCSRSSKTLEYARISLQNGVPDQVE